MKEKHNNTYTNHIQINQKQKQNTQEKTTT